MLNDDRIVTVLCEIRDTNRQLLECMLDSQRQRAEWQAQDEGRYQDWVAKENEFRKAWRDDQEKQTAAYKKMLRAYARNAALSVGLIAVVTILFFWLAALKG